MVHMNRHESRENAMIVLYQHYLLQEDVDELIDQKFQLDSEDIDPYILNVIHTAANNTNNYSKQIDKILIDWSYERLGFIEKALLNMGCAEFEINEVERPVIINEAVELAKEYCDAETYKLINRVLDEI